MGGCRGPSYQARWRHHGLASGEAYLVRSLTYELTFAGQAGAALRAQFDDCEVTTGPGTTTLRAVLPDQAALAGLVLRVIDLRLEVIQVLRVTPPADGQPAAEQNPEPAGS